jgi:hypothetical protein
MSSGAFLLLATLALWIADAVGSLSPARDASWSSWTLKGGAALLGAGFLLRVLSPVRKGLGREHCAVCSRPIDRGHVYCHDHMQAKVNAYRDEAHDRVLRARRGPSSSS